jgi:hypothetical protein
MTKRKDSSRALARTWPYPRRVRFQREMRQTAARYFAGRNLPVDQKHPFILARYPDWPQNIILPAAPPSLPRV